MFEFKPSQVVSYLPPNNGPRRSAIVERVTQCSRYASLVVRTKEGAAFKINTERDDIRPEG